MSAIRAKGKSPAVLAVSFAAAHAAHTATICVAAEATGSNSRTGRFDVREIETRYAGWSSYRTNRPRTLKVKIYSQTTRSIRQGGENKKR